MKLVIKRARDTFKAGDEVEVTAAEGAVLINDGIAVTASEHYVAQALRTSSEARIDTSIKAARSRGAVAPKDEAVRATAIKRLDAGNEVELICDVIDGMPGTGQNALTQRTSQFQRSLNGGVQANEVWCSGESMYDTAVNGYCKARENLDGLIRSGKEGVVKASEISRETSARLQRMMSVVRPGDDLAIKEIVRAADTTDGNVGTIATGLILMRNLGFLKNKLGWMPYISTDLRNEPALFNQPVFTRYITPPAVVAYNTTTGWADQTPSTTDVTVTIDQHYGVPITFQTQLLGSTVRALFAEQQGAQIYALAEKVNQTFLTALFSATWTGTVNTFAKPLANFDIKSLVGIKNRLSLSKVADVGRFALLHSCYHDKLLEDSNLILANTLMAALGKDAASYNTGELPTLFGIKALESQLAVALNGTLGSITDPNDFSAVNQVGFAGNMSSMLFASRVPQDYTTVFRDIPATAAIEIITDPDSGLSMMFAKYLNHQLAATTARCALMWGNHQGDPRQGIIITP